MSKKMCKLYSLAEKETKAYSKYVLPVKYVCKKCGRVANSEELLCRPKELEIKKAKGQKEKVKEEQQKKNDKEKCDKKHKKDKTSKKNKLKNEKIKQKDQKKKVKALISNSVNQASTLGTTSNALSEPQNPPDPIDAESIKKYIVKAASTEASIEKKRVQISKSQVLK